MSDTHEATAWLNDPDLRPWSPHLTPAPGSPDPDSPGAAAWAPESSVYDTSTPGAPPAWPTAQPSAVSVRPTPPAETSLPAVGDHWRPSPNPRPRPGPPPPPAWNAFTIAPEPVAIPRRGWRAAVYTASGGSINPGVGEAEALQWELLKRVRRQLPGTHQVVVSSLKGGSGKTTVAAGLGLTFAEYRGDRVVAVDANPDAGTLADRLTRETGVTVRQMLDNLASIDSMTEMSRYTSLAGRLAVLASEQDPAMSEAFNRDEYERICTVLARFFNLIITDSGTGLVHSAMAGALGRADTLVIVGAPTIDGASRASKTLDWLIAHGYSDLVERAVVALCHDRSSPLVDQDAVRDHFARRCRAVVDIPADPHLAVGGVICLPELHPRTRDAFVTLAAHVGDGFTPFHTPPHPTRQDRP